MPPPPDSVVRAKLHEVFGHDAFRPLQGQVVDAILNRRDAFVLMPTGGGKSLCYQLPALLMDGLVVVISPLIALMKDQVDKLVAAGIAATYINSSLDSDEIAQRYAAVARGAVKLLYVAPERLTVQSFMRLLHAAPIAFFAVDEAHCISEWGHDFRPEYRELNRLRELFPGVPVAAFTATATERVQADIVGQLGLADATLFKGSFNRPNLHYAVKPKGATYEQLRAYLWGRRDQSGIIYCQARNTTEEVARKLRLDGVDAAAYHAGLESDERQRVQEAFQRDEVRVIVATIAFGMGIDKPDVRFVIHYDLPKNLEGYYQESGRAGRDGLPSDCILFYGRGDAMKYRRFIDEKADPRERQIASAQLRQMTDWADSATCRREALLAYFDERLAERPARCCDVCDNPPEEADQTVAAQKLLSCVVRTGERFGAAHVIDVLLGEQTEKVERFGHDRVSTFGIGRELDKGGWRHVARELTRTGYLEESPDLYRTLSLTARGHEALRSREPIMLSRAREVVVPTRSRRPAVSLQREAAARARGAAARDEVDETPYAGELFEELRALRKRLADARAVPAYVVFPDATLREMAARMPADRFQLGQINGVGPAKLRDYADPFLELIGQFRQRTGLAPASGDAGPRLL